MKTCLRRTRRFSMGMELLLSAVKSARTLEAVLAGKGQVLLEGRNRCSARVPEEEISQQAGQQEMAGAQTHTHTSTNHTCSWCNLWWQTQAGLGNSPAGVVITLLSLWACVLLAVYPSTMSKCVCLWGLACCYLLGWCCRTAGQPPRGKQKVCERLI